MTMSASGFLTFGAVVLYGGLITTIVVNIKSSKN